MGKATQDLRKEHGSILYVLKILEKMMASNDEEDSTRLDHYKNIVYFLQIFADKCHHGKEENYLFVEMIKNGFQKDGGPLAIILQEHEQAREYTVRMNEAVDRRDITGFNDAAEAYSDLLRNHVDREENVIFAMADKTIDEEAQNALFEKFEEYEETVIGRSVHEELHAMIDEWAQYCSMK